MIKFYVANLIAIALAIAYTLIRVIKVQKIQSAIVRKLAGEILIIQLYQMLLFVVILADKLEFAIYCWTH
ncbi:MAG: hypothetical protein ACLS8Q_00610 [Anaerovoracaceae bacterium]